MRRVFESCNSAEAGLLKSMLEDEGIACVIKNDMQAFQAVMPAEVWVLDDHDYPQAMEFCRGWRTPEPEQALTDAASACPQCGEKIEKQFANCWNCGTALSSATVDTSAQLPAAQNPALLTEITLPSAAESAESSLKGTTIHGSPWIALMFGVLAIAACLNRNWAYLSDRTAAFYSPTETALWLVDRQMTLYEGLENASRFTRVFLAWHQAGIDRIAGNCESILEDTIRFAKEKRATNEIAELQATLAILRTELDTRKRFPELTEKSTNVAQFGQAVQAFIITNSLSAFSVAGSVFQIRSFTWAEDQLKGRFLRANERFDEAMAVHSGLDELAEAISAKQLLLLTLYTLFHLAGLAVLIWLAVKRTARQMEVPLMIPWQGWHGLTLFFAGFFLGLGLELALFKIVGFRRLAETSYSLITWMPFYVWFAFKWRQPEGVSLRTLLTLGPAGARQWRLLAAAVGLFVLQDLASVWISSAAHVSGLQSHWAEGLVEAEHFEPWPARLFVMANGILWAPLGEEVAFRAILFLALLRWLPVSVSAAASAVTFAAFHFYSWPGFLSITAFGFINAMALYKTRSLIPCIVAHIITNALIVGGTAWVYAF